MPRTPLQEQSEEDSPEKARGRCEKHQEHLTNEGKRSMREASRKGRVDQHSVPAIKTSWAIQHLHTVSHILERISPMLTVRHSSLFAQVGQLTLERRDRRQIDEGLGKSVIDVYMRIQ